MSDMSLDTRAMSLDRDFSLLQSLVSRYVSQASTKVCLKDGSTQRVYGAMLMGIKKVGENCQVPDIACFPTVHFEHPATYSIMFHDNKTQYNYYVRVIMTPQISLTLSSLFIP